MAVYDKFDEGDKRQGACTSLVYRNVCHFVSPLFLRKVVRHIFQMSATASAHLTAIPCSIAHIDHNECLHRHNFPSRSQQTAHLHPCTLAPCSSSLSRRLYHSGVYQICKC